MFQWMPGTRRAAAESASGSSTWAKTRHRGSGVRRPRRSSGRSWCGSSGTRRPPFSPDGPRHPGPSAPGARPAAEGGAQLDESSGGDHTMLAVPARLVASICAQVGSTAGSGSQLCGLLSHRSAKIQALQQLRDVRSSAATGVVVPCRRSFRVGGAPVDQTRFRRTSPTVGRIALDQVRQVRADPLLQAASRIHDRRQVGDSPVSGGHTHTPPRPGKRRTGNPRSRFFRPAGLDRASALVALEQ